MRNLFNLGLCFAMICSENTGENAGESCADIDSFSRPGKSIAKKAADELLKEQEDAKVAETKKQLAIDNYKQGYEKLQLRRERANESAQKAKLASLTEENTKFAEGDVDLKEHRENLSKINETYDKAIQKASREYSDGIDNLRKSNPTGYASYRGW